MTVTVLIVDDSRLLRRGVRRVLEQAGCSVAEAASAEEARTLLESKDFSLITLDIEMPGENGYKLCQWIRDPHRGAATSTTPVVFITANDTIEGRLQGFAAGATEFVTKDKIETLLVPVVEGITRPTMQFSGQTALIIDDDPEVVTLTSSWLTPVGVRCVGATTANGAIELLKGNPQGFGLIVIDLNLPDKNGEHLCLYIRRELGLRSTPIIVLSGSDRSDRRLLAFQCGATDYLVKPFPRPEFIERTRVHLANRVMYERVEQVNHDLKRSNKALSECASIVAHDIRDPLCSIRGLFATLLDHIPEHDQTEEIRSIAAMADSTIDGMDTLLMKILDSAQASSAPLNIQLVALRDCVNQVITQLQQPLLRHGGEIICASSTTIAADRILLVQLLQNLCANSLKFGRSGVSPRITITSCSVAGGTQITLADNGRGFPNERGPSLFGRFSRMESSSGIEGKGLGLSTCQAIVERHGGSITAQGIPDVGATFTIVLPHSID